MHLEPKQINCCPRKQEFYAKCFTPAILKKYSLLSKKLETKLTPGQRICKLAAPKYVIKKFQAKCLCKSPRRIEMANEQGRQTRTNQLSYPPVRRLLCFKEEFEEKIGKKRMLVLNRTIRRSLFSVYSRLENVQPPQEKEPVYKWKEQDWEEHGKYLASLSKPKKMSRIPKEQRSSLPINEMTRYKALAIPKNRVEYEKPEWTFNDNLKFYQPTKRILELGKSKSLAEDIYNRPFPIPISRSALNYKASERILKLNERPEIGLKETDLKENPFVVSRNALKYKASQRIEELAEPKEYETNHIRENPNAISPAALKAKPSPRIIALAQTKRKPA